MRKRSMVHCGFIAILLGMLIVAAGCGPPRDLGFGGQADDVRVGAEDNGGKVEVNPGQTLVLTLESNPSTGFRWEVIEAKDSILRQQGEAEFTVAAASDPPPPGTGGVEVFRFETVEAGETQLRLVYHRPWEEDVEPVETYSIQVVVR